jgi:hypothetical protein
MTKKNRGYLGNKNLRQPNLAINYTEETLKEYVKCSESCLYFIQNYVKIITIDRGAVLFNPFDFQKDLLDLVINNRFTIAKLSRQVGKTEIISAIILWYILFNKTYNIGIFSNKASNSRKVLSRIKFAYEKLPIWLQQGILEWNKGSILLENFSQIIATSTSGSSGRGNTYNLIYLDEFAHVPLNIQEELMSSVLPTISSGESAKLCISSTPNGQDLFYKYWQEAVAGINGFAYIEGDWRVRPGRTEEWAEKERAQLGDVKFAQEHECSFEMSLDTLIDQVVLNSIPIPEQPLPQNAFIFHKQPEPGAEYIATVDTSANTGNDNAAISVFNVSKMPYEQVAVFYGNKTSKIDLTKILHTIALKYNEAYVLIELNSGGETVSDLLFRDFEYYKILGTKKSKMGIMELSMHTTAQMGIYTTKRTKITGCSNLKSLIEKNKLKINDEKTIKELRTYCKSETGFQAQMGHQDDLVMTCVLFAWCTTQALFSELFDIESMPRTDKYEELDVESSYSTLVLGSNPNVKSMDDWLKE